MSIEEQNVYFRAGAGVVIYNDHEEVLMFMRAGHTTEVFGLQFPQGGLDAGESAKTGMWRELFEETALQQSDFTQIDFYPNWIGYEYDEDAKKYLQSRNIKNTGQVQRWAFAKAPNDLEVNLDLAQDKEFDSYLWVPVEECVGKVVPFKREMYRTLINYMQNNIL